MPFTSKRRYDFWGTQWNAVGAIYGILNEKGGVIYVGQTADLQRRLYRGHTLVQDADGPVTGVANVDLRPQHGVATGDVHAVRAGANF